MNWPEVGEKILFTDSEVLKIINDPHFFVSYINFDASFGATCPANFIELNRTVLILHKLFSQFFVVDYFLSG